MFKKWIIPAASLLCAAILLCGIALARQQKTLSDKLIRLHVVANSDSEADQRDKLLLRDHILQITDALVHDAQDPQAAIRENLPYLQRESEAFLRSVGNRQPVKVSFCRELFSERDYDTFSLPAGVYRTLRITVGEGKGHNWWCVVFPSLCMSANMEEFEQACAVAGLTDGEQMLITKANEGYELKFRSIEILQKIKNYLADR